MESTSDKARALLFSLLLHALIVLAALIGVFWTRETRPVVMPGPIIEATLVGPTAAPKPSATRAKPAPPKAESKPEPPKLAEPVAPPPTPEPPAPKPTPTPPEPPPPPPKQDTVDQERVAAMAAEKAEQQKKEQEAKQRQRQIELEQEKQEAARQKELEDIRKKRIAAAKKTELEKQKLEQLQDRQAAAAEAQKADQAKQLAQQAEHEAKEAQTGANGQDNDLRARYAAAIQAAVTRAWNRPESAQGGLRCALRIVQIPGGDVLSVSVASPCNADGAARNSIEQAVMRAAPLPYEGYQQVFERDITFNFRYDG
ncbi:cell envelope integrity protein TolA [Dokdonella sp. MW10]|uniref:cell envelope integrity protein TolA n=1 Tax=Dokdonella sp. MW10 TaxID=2992926 RepID=UPI003F7CE560